MSKMRFRPGRILATAAADRAMRESNIDPVSLIALHCLGEWGDLDKHDVKVNEQALRDKGRVMSVYFKNLFDIPTLWVITDGGHEVTTIMLPEDY